MAKNDGTVKFSKSLEYLASEDEDGNKINVCVVRNSQIDLLDSKKNVISNWTVPYGAKLHVKDGAKVSTGDILFLWILTQMLYSLGQQGLLDIKI